MAKQGKTETDLIPADIADEVFETRKIVNEGKYEIYGCQIYITVEECTVKCPRVLTCDPGLTISGDVPEIYIYSSAPDAQAKVDGSVISFGETTLEFLNNCKDFTVGGQKYAAGEVGAGFSYEFGDGALIAAHRAQVPA